MLNAYYTTTRSDMFEYLPDRMGKVLEIGCSSGGFSSAIKQGGAEVWGVEPHREAALLAEARLDRVLIGTYSEVADGLPDHYFDVVICNDVIEHMPDHDLFLQQIKAKLAPGGVLVGSLPNIRFITALIKVLVLRDWPYSDEGILDRTHLRFFTRKSIVAALQRNGYRIEAIRGNRSAIRHGFLNMGRGGQLALRIATALIVVGTLGFYGDIQYAQFGFRARPE